ncbi:MAG: CBS domain-containing protein [Myroides sp.]|nr:CBS domain-containing protein [Myroides sp.]
MVLNIPVKQIMSKQLVTLTEKNSLYDAEKLFKKHKIRHLPVVEDHKLVGVLSYSDLLKISYADVTEGEEDVEAVVYDMFSIVQVMAKAPVTVTTETPLKEVIQQLIQQTFHSLPVIEENGDLVGIVTTTDLLEYFLKNA